MMMDRRLKYRMRIVSNRQIPSSSDGKGPANSRYNLHSMEVDDYFFVNKSEASKARAAVYVYAKRHGVIFKTKAAGDDRIIIFRIQ